jgi:Zn-dependent protease
MRIDQLFLIDRLIRVLPVILSLCLHELMHGWVALLNGDPTAKRAGRITLNPLAHLDVAGTVCLLIGPIGWARPVPVAPENFRARKFGEVTVALAGVTSNLLLAIVFSMVFRLLVHLGWKPEGTTGAVLVLMLYAGILVNFGLCVFNLLPIAPLDGHHVVREMLPTGPRARFMEYSRYGWILLLGLVLLDNGSGMRMLLVPIGYLMDFFAGGEIGEYGRQAEIILRNSL